MHACVYEKIIGPCLRGSRLREFDGVFFVAHDLDQCASRRLTERSVRQCADRAPSIASLMSQPVALLGPPACCPARCYTPRGECRREVPRRSAAVYACHHLCHSMVLLRKHIRHSAGSLRSTPLYPLLLPIQKKETPIGRVSFHSKTGLCLVAFIRLTALV
jgi:hypothetical protein